jgi:UDPglucose 6-dehydrogenase
MQIAVIGPGYTGLVRVACFADFGHSVTCVGMDPDVGARRGAVPQWATV